MDYKAEYDAARRMIEDELNSQFLDEAPQKELYESMRYSLLAGGKRIRPVMVLKFAEAVGGDMKKALPIACGVEELHTYSLIHDDLPCMDDDELRRGKPTNHILFGECTATIAGDALQAAAFESVLSADLPAERVARAALELAVAAGRDGMCGGQVLDMEGETRRFSIDEVNVTHELKTAAMIKAAARMGVIAGGGSEEQLAAAEKYADAIGLAFQIRDDVLDVTATEEELGKPIGSDAANGKSTFYTLLGIDECERIIDEKTEEAKAALKGAFADTGFFDWLAELLAKRKN